MRRELGELDKWESENKNNPSNYALQKLKKNTQLKLQLQKDLENITSEFSDCLD
jgi:hypothetical protein